MNNTMPINECKHVKISHYPTVEEVSNLLDIIYIAMRKQTPMIPDDINTQTFDASIGICPICKNGVNGSMNYCDKCGQKLDWSDLDE